MAQEPGAEDWDRQALALTQAALGAITPNFRIIALALCHDGWVLRFVLAAASADDMTLIADIVRKFHSLQRTSLECIVEIVITPMPITMPCFGRRAVYRRWED